MAERKGSTASVPHAAARAATVASRRASTGIPKPSLVLGSPPLSQGSARSARSSRSGVGTNQPSQSPARSVDFGGTMASPIHVSSRLKPPTPPSPGLSRTSSGHSFRSEHSAKSAPVLSRAGGSHARRGSAMSSSVASPDDAAKSVHAAAALGDLEAVVAYLDAGGHVDVRATKQSSAPLARAASKGHLGVVELLLSRGAAVNAVGRGGMGALHEAAGCGQAAVCKLLLERGADTAAVDFYERTPLHYTNSPAVARLLLGYGADPNVKDRNGRRADDIATSTEVRQLVRESRCAVKAGGAGGSNASLVIADLRGRLESAELRVLEASADKDAQIEALRLEVVEARAEARDELEEERRRGDSVTQLNLRLLERIEKDAAEYEEETAELQARHERELRLARAARGGAATAAGVDTSGDDLDLDLGSGNRESGGSVSSPSAAVAAVEAAVVAATEDRRRSFAEDMLRMKVRSLEASMESDKKRIGSMSSQIKALHSAIYKSRTINMTLSGQMSSFGSQRAAMRLQIDRLAAERDRLAADAAAAAAAIGGASGPGSPTSGFGGSVGGGSMSNGGGGGGGGDRSGLKGLGSGDGGDSTDGEDESSRCVRALRGELECTRTALQAAAADRAALEKRLAAMQAAAAEAGEHAGAAAVSAATAVADAGAKAAAIEATTAEAARRLRAIEERAADAEDALAAAELASVSLRRELETVREEAAESAAAAAEAAVAAREASVQADVLENRMAEVLNDLAD
ncbi:unnamed protein product, partial [Phaeothamnion confervicola]